METEVTRRFVPPLGWPLQFKAALCWAADPPPLLFLNCYPRQVIGLCLRLPRWGDQGWIPRYPYLSLLWARPARWWNRPLTH